MEHPSKTQISSFSENIRKHQSGTVHIQLHHSRWKALNILGGIVGGTFPLVMMIVFFILAMNTFDTNRHLSLQYYGLSVAIPLYSFIPILLASSICMCIKRIRTLGRLSLVLLLCSIPLLGLMFIVLAFGSDGYIGVSAVPFLAGMR